MFCVKKSEVDIDLVSFPDTEDPGMGLFQLKKGLFKIKIIGSGDVESIPRTRVHRLQREYMIDSGFDEDNVIVPTLDSIRTNTIHIGFRVQHTHVNPTHYLDWEDTGKDFPHSFPFLYPRRILEVDTEITFNYNLH